MVLPFANVLPMRQQAWDSMATRQLQRVGGSRPFGPPVTGQTRIAGFQFEDVWAGGPPSPMTRLASAGLAFEDLLRLAAVGANTNLGMSPAQAVASVEDALRVLAQGWPDLGLRDAIGWTMLGWHVTGGFAPDLLVGFVKSWLDDPDIPPDGWVYLGAGFTVMEITDHSAAGTLDRDVAAAMAALNGTVLPVG